MTWNVVEHLIKYVIFKVNMLCIGGLCFKILLTAGVLNEIIASICLLFYYQILTHSDLKSEITLNWHSSFIDEKMGCVLFDLLVSGSYMVEKIAIIMNYFRIDKAVWGFRIIRNDNLIEKLEFYAVL